MGEAVGVAYWVATTGADYSVAETSSNIRALAFTTNEINAHINTLTNKWGIPQTFTALRITNVSVSNTTINFAKVGLFYTNTVAIDTAVVVRKYGVDVGDASATSYTITHNLNTRDVQVVLFDNSSPYAEVICDVQHTTVNTVTLLFSIAPTLNQYRVVIQG
jgi:hypothetical protein